jgi:hypothetical protein
LLEFEEAFVVEVDHGLESCIGVAGVYLDDGGSEGIGMKWGTWTVRPNM